MFCSSANIFNIHYMYILNIRMCWLSVVDHRIECLTLISMYFIPINFRYTNQKNDLVYFLLLPPRHLFFPFFWLHVFGVRQRKNIFSVELGSLYIVKKCTEISPIRSIFASIFRIYTLSDMSSFSALNAAQFPKHMCAILLFLS